MSDSEEMAAEDVVADLTLIKLNPRLKSNLLKKLLTLPLSETILVDETLYPNSLMAGFSDAEKIYATYDRSYFGVRKDHRISKKLYKMHRHSLLQKGIVVGDKITLLLDGKTYEVVEIDEVSKKYTITEASKRLVTLRVPEAVIKR